MAQVPSSVQQSLDGTKVEYVRVGSSGLHVSTPILGAMSLGSSKWLPWVLDEDATFEILKAAYDRGLNTWDTANAYSNGLSEEVIGKALRKFSIPREKVVIMTKCFLHVAEDVSVFSAPFGPTLAKSKDYVNQGGLSRAAIFNAVEASLTRLGTNYIDLYQIHRFDPTTPIEETMKALHDLVQSGKVRYIGASSMWATQFARMQAVAESKGWTKFISMQNYYHLCYREEEREMNRFCNETGVGILPYSANFGGNLARPFGKGDSTRAKGPSPVGKGFTSADEEIIRRVEKLAVEKGWKMSQVNLAWHQAKGSVPIVGFNSVARIDEACGVRGKTLTAEEVAFLEEPYVAKPVVGHF
ncbi:Aldo/keto reductase [Annulohypoxylon maeteangense]|uniref:Aldo/keto reductase n=1 Tax=Annulohypoxylon maeteangense TaxID=1927788 RepID=UPI002007C419|nr:Aldo/keto reductase [Annulohypoxylon maeteangense]KAI0880671.1 Aldo/keto reductase [Annulohypoxylon maeteangense]